MIRIRRILFLLILTCGLAACSLPERGCSGPQVFCVGLVTNTAGLQDHGLTQSAWEGLQRALQEGWIQKADFIESVDPRDYGKNIATFAEQGYDLVITSGPGLSEATLAQAALHPQVHFLGLAQEAPAQPVDNLSIMTFPEEQGGFLAGVLAARTSRTGVVGAVCETSELDSMWHYCQGFKAGAEYENKQVQVLIAYHEAAGREDLFNDEAWADGEAGDMALRGADVIFGVGGRLGQQVLRRAAEQGLWCIGSERDQYYVTGEARATLLSSAVPQAGEALYQFLKGFRQGEVQGSVSGSMTLAPYHDGDRFVPLSVQADLLGLQAALQSGQIRVEIEETR